MTETTIRVPQPEEQPLLDVWPDAAAIFGMGRAAAYAHAATDTLPVPVLRVGRRLRVRTADVRRVLGLDA